jgi:hypothetical protein
VGRALGFFLSDCLEDPFVGDDGFTHLHAATVLIADGDETVGELAPGNHAPAAAPRPERRTCARHAAFAERRLLLQGFRSWVIRRSHFALDFPIPH